MTRRLAEWSCLTALPYTCLIGQCREGTQRAVSLYVYL